MYEYIQIIRVNYDPNMAKQIIIIFGVILVCVGIYLGIDEIRSSYYRKHPSMRKRRKRK